jgi:hypothetical protein
MYSVKKKNASGKFWSYGNVKRNQYGNLSLGFKVTPELKAIFNDAEDGQWVNFSLFEEEKKPTAHDIAKQDGYAPSLDDDLPF